MWEQLKTLIQTNVLWIHLSQSTLSFPLRFSVYIWTTGNWTGVWVSCVCWCTLSFCVSPSSSSSTYSPSSICQPAAKNEKRSFSRHSLLDLARIMAQVLDQRQTGCSEGIFIYWSSWSSIDPLFFFSMGAILIESLGLWCYKRREDCVWGMVLLTDNV